MNDVGGKIIELLDAIYNLSDADRQKLNWSIKSISDADKEKILVAVFERYQAFEKNIKTLSHNLQHISNDVDEAIEHQDAESVLLEL